MLTPEEINRNHRLAPQAPFIETEFNSVNALGFNRQILSVLASTVGLRGEYRIPVDYGVWASRLI
jgi:hypothetical protein